MKKFLVASGVAILAFASVAAAQGYQFSTNLTVGSTGADVVALQSWLIANGYNIPAIASGAASKGYFGSQTQSAVEQYQAAVGLPSTGFVGPLTRGKLNGTAATAMTTTTTCPAGFTCTPVAGTTVAATTATTVAAPVGITTPGVPGTIAVSLWSTPSGVNVYKGQSYDIGAYKVQAGASDMAISSLTFDFSDRLWLYANTITVKDETGAVVGTVSNLNASNFSELTVGSDYRVSVPVNNLVVKASQSKYLTVNLSFNAVSDRCPAGSCDLYIDEAQVRAVDGTGVTDTETVGDGTLSNANSRLFTYNGSNVGQVYVTTDTNQPATQLVQLSTAVQTQNVLLGIFDIKSANEPSTMQSLNIQIHTNGKASVAQLFNNIQIKVGGLTYSASSIGTTDNAQDTPASSTVGFTNLQIPLSADVYTPVSVYVTLAPDTTGSLNGSAASTTLVAGGPAAGNTNNPGVVDATYNNLLVNAGTITNNDQTFVDTGVTIPSLQVTYGSRSCNTNNTSCDETFNIIYSIQAGNNAVYISNYQTNGTYDAISTSSSPAGLEITTKNLTDNNTNGDTSNYFYVAPGQSKTFTASYDANGPIAGGVLKVASLNYGTDANSQADLKADQLSNSTITSTLQPTLFQ